VNATTPAPEQEKPESSVAEPVAAAAPDDDVRTEAIASLKRKRKFAQDAIGYVSVNGVLWLIWALSDRSTDGSMPWPAWVSAIWGFLLAVDAWRAYGSWPASLHRPITEADIEREMKRSRDR
jgi:hypothetical protein